MNAKNRMGGYTGQAPFFGYFDTTGKPAGMTIVDDNVRGAVVSASPGTPLWREHWMLDQCGML